MNTMQNEYILSEEVKNAILFEILKDQIGYQKAHDLYETALEVFNPVEYAVLKTKEVLEKR